MKGIDKLCEWFTENPNVCAKEVELTLNEECYVIDPNIIDNENGMYAYIPCVVVRIDMSQTIPGRKYYMLQAKESINDEQLNSLEEAGIKFYKYLENTSPYLFKINNTIG